MRAIHHLEIWTTDLSTAEPAFGWLLTALGWTATPVEGWDIGRIWTAPTGEYLVLEQSPAITGPMDRMRAGVNHLALGVSSRVTLDALRDGAAEHGWHELFAEKYPHAGGDESVALYLESGEGFEVELMVE